MQLEERIISSNVLGKEWLYSPGDERRWADTAFDDSRWQTVNTDMDSMVHNVPYYRNYTIGWFRLHFVADSSMVNVPLAMTLTHMGASEVYLDGERIRTYGKINGRDSSRYVNPFTDPAYFVLTRAAHHVLAVRYANYDADKNYRTYNSSAVGFDIAIMTAQHFTSVANNKLVSNTFIFILMFGIFIALSTSHLFLYLYNRGIRSNLFFSLFCMGFALLFYTAWLTSGTASPAIELSSYYSIPTIISLICFSLSGFVNELFSKKRLRFTIISVQCLVFPLAIWLSKDYKNLGSIGLYALVVLVLLETIVLIIKAIVRKVRGARIIGVGVLMFAIFLFCTLIYIAANQGLTFDEENSVGAAVFLGLAALSFMALPVSMSLFLAWNFAYINKQLKNNLQQVKELSDKTIAQELERTRLIESRKEELEHEVTTRTAEVVAQKQQLERRNDELKTEKQRSDDLLLNILPGEIAEELKQTGHSDARLFNNVSVMFTDFVNFTQAGERMSPQELVDELHVCFRTFDEIISKYGIEKIKTIGDAYLAVSGLPLPDPDHAAKVTKAALEILAFMKARREMMPQNSFRIRIGIHSGSVVAGIVGIKKFAYDIWGDTVNTAARMESSSEPGRINVSEATYVLIRERFRCTHRGMINARNKGEMNMYFVEGEK
ncbi:hypothetical protein GCM10023093_10860 [Nemorincola caseinilytica]|uniref:Guanylate cyclase domain-containing protein n=1 Tax=Nemorincola caseinilytica TaxID=2054315 RepID=A0ABP8NBD9_9BACT